MSGGDTPKLPQDEPSEKVKPIDENTISPLNDTKPAAANDSDDSKAGPAHDTPTPPKVASFDDPEAQALIISSLKSQILDLSTQVTQLNGKLIRSYDRISDLEDSLHSSTTKLDSSKSRISLLERERTQHLSALDTGLLVERTHVTAELTRLMEKASEEAIHRGEAESRRTEIERELDDLSASLFEQANVMVRDARGQKALSDRRANEAEVALRAAEEAVQLMQQSLQQMQHDKDEAEKTLRDMKGKNRVVDRPNPVASLRLLNSHAPYYEFLSFISHLRSLHLPASQPPTITTLLPLPFVARLLSEDMEPTVRLDLAPSLNWLSRRAVLAAIHNGQLTIEPMATSTLLSEPSVLKQSSASPTTASPHSPFVTNTSSYNIPCALCGTPIFGHTESQHGTRPPTHPALAYGGTMNAQNSSWSTSIFRRNPAVGGLSDSSPSRPDVKQVYVFRLASATSSFQSLPLPISFPTSLQSHSSASTAYSASNTPSTSRVPTPSQTPLQLSSPQNTASTIYPLCSNGWCLVRLRTTCSLWAYVRAGIVEKVWEEEIMSTQSGVSAVDGDQEKLGGPHAVSRKNSSEEQNPNGKPPIPPRRRGLWGMASALGERAASWTREPSRDRTHSDAKSSDDEKRFTNPLPPPPPTHPSVTHSDTSHVPPPLPKRSEGRRPVPPPPSTDPSAPMPQDVGGTGRHRPVPSPPSTETPAPVESTTQDTHDLAAREFKLSESSATIEGGTDFDQPPVSPRRVPLPESRPATPTQIFRGPKLTPSSTPSRSGSPTPGVAPPLPRRAAARPRPLSTLGGEALPTPAPETHDEQPATTAVIPSANGAEGLEDKADTHDEGKEYAPAPVVDNSLSSEVRDTDVPNQADKSDHNTEPVPDEKDDKPDREQTGATEKEAESLPYSESLQKAGGDKEADMSDKFLYIGDSTWEERAWREIIRLKEDMFLARVGASR
ncbi:hypothetical protein PTI98_008744 [Pleurotus ostreatus]|uniref:Uncharacterized protein n=1 Tax=Pleurotus cornucopiae TaxID=5321 RepID=A0ACB7IV80_PLECO|nr:hypothetical protein CCMSSC00406_0006699 [Pleurotus cornucopiae]KAJ8693784.1 hypothetical protein PTI98_008744 [Pleurotus ostreatus]